MGGRGFINIWGFSPVCFSAATLTSMGTEHIVKHRETANRSNTHATNFHSAAGLACRSTWSKSSRTRAKATSAPHPTSSLPHFYYSHSLSFQARSTTDGTRVRAHTDRKHTSNNQENDISAAQMEK